MRKIKKQDLLALCMSDQIVKALEVNGLLDDFAVGVAISRVEQISGQTIEETAEYAAKMYEKIEEPDKDTLLVLLQLTEEMADVIEKVFSATDANQAVNEINYYHGQDFSENLDETIKDVKDKIQKTRSKL